jgi:hypothetical protein
MGVGQSYANNSRSREIQARHLGNSHLTVYGKSKKGKTQGYAVTLYEINKALEAKDLQEKPLEEIIPKEYYKFLPLFIKVIAEMLRLHQSYDHKMMLHEGFTLAFGPIYSLSRKELLVVKEWIQKNLSK